MNIKINGIMLPASICTKQEDRTWNNRESKVITLEMDHAEAAKLFVNDLVWSVEEKRQVAIVRLDENGDPVLDSEGAETYDIVEKVVETDMSDFCVAGTITDHRNGTVTVKMGKVTAEEINAILMGGI